MLRYMRIVPLLLRLCLYSDYIRIAYSNYVIRLLFLRNQPNIHSTVYISTLYVFVKLKITSKERKMKKQYIFIPGTDGFDGVIINQLIGLSTAIRKSPLNTSITLHPVQFVSSLC